MKKNKNYQSVATEYIIDDINKLNIRIDNVNYKMSSEIIAINKGFRNSKARDWVLFSIIFVLSTLYLAYKYGWFR